MGVFDKQICTEKSKWRIPANQCSTKGKLWEEAETLFHLGTSNLIFKQILAFLNKQ